MRHFVKQITWAKWKCFDPHESQYFTNFIVIIPGPTFEYPCASVMISIFNAKSKVLIRFASLAALRQVFIIPEEYTERLENGYREAVQQANKIQGQLKALMQMGNLPPDTKVVRTDTGEVIAEALEIIKDAGRFG